jgi:hypothetical protein
VLRRLDAGHLDDGVIVLKEVLEPGGQLVELPVLGSDYLDN